MRAFVRRLKSVRSSSARRQTRCTKPGNMSYYGEFDWGGRCPDELLCSSADGPLGETFLLCYLRTLGSTKPSSVLTLFQPLDSPSDRRVAIDLDVTQADFDVGGLCNPVSATTPRILLARSDTLPSGSTAANWTQLPNRVFFLQEHGRLPMKCSLNALVPWSVI